MTTWPSNLPPPRADGASYQPLKGAARFEADSGPASQRAISTVISDQLTLTYRLSLSQHDAMMTFYYGEAGQGGVWFDFYHPFRKVNGQARFLSGQEPRVSPVPPKFDVNVVLEFIG